jgi:hypothetical protein
MCLSHRHYGAAVLLHIFFMFGTVTTAFQSTFSPAMARPIVLSGRESTTTATLLFETRRDFVEKFPTSFTAAMIVASTTIGSIRPVEASGGATAGGAYLLSVRSNCIYFCFRLRNIHRPNVLSNCLHGFLYLFYDTLVGKATIQ